MTRPVEVISDEIDQSVTVDVSERIAEVFAKYELARDVVGETAFNAFR